MPKVSIIIPVYNSEHFIKDTLDSVFKQTYKDFEVIVVDDGSTDSTYSLLKRYGNRIVLLRKQNGGPASARNLGIKHSTGKYICFLDSDDLWTPNKLQDQVNYMNVNNCGLLYTDVKVFRTKNNIKYTIGTLKCNLEGMIFKDLFWNNFIVNSTVMIRKSCISKIGLLDESIRIVGAEDYDYWLRLSLCFKVGHISKTLVYYRLHNNNLLGNSYEKSYYLCDYIYRKFFRLYPEVSIVLTNDLSNCLSDLYLRYAYKNCIDDHKRLAIKKIVKALPYSFINGIIVFCLILIDNRDPKIWEKVIPKFNLWHRIVSNKWVN